MFDIGFAELIIIGVVALLVIGPERLPGAIRTASAWLNRFRRGFNEIKQEVQQELHNDEIMRDLRESRDHLRRETDSLRQDLTRPLEDTKAALTGSLDLDAASTTTKIDNTTEHEATAGAPGANETPSAKPEPKDD